MSQIQDRLEEIAKFTQREDDVLALRDHLRDVLDSPSFSNSRRSGQFLQYVVEQALLQHNDALKERIIGVEVFQRSPGYDTGEDAIVRVTASDVRRRLAQHYRSSGRTADFRISLPPGGYVPEIERAVPTGESVLSLPADEAEIGPPVPRQDMSVHSIPVPLASTVATQASSPMQSAQKSEERQRRRSLNFLAYGTLVAFVFFTAGGLLFGTQRSSDIPVLEPWAKLFRGGQTVSVVLADPDLNEIQLLTKQYVAVSDYANGKLGCDTLMPELQRVCKESLRGDKVAEVDATAVVRIAGIGAHFHGHVEPHAARSLRLPDLQGDRNFIILGSKVADPWADLYRGRTDFYIDHDAATGLQVVRNQHPHPGEPATYVPTAGPYGTGDNYALISFVHNLSGNGYALLLAGCTHEGMDAAMAALLDKAKFEQALRACGVSDREPFQMLMRIHMMAGSSLTAEQLTCHRLE